MMADGGSDKEFDALVLRLYCGVREVPFTQFQDHALRLIKPVLEFDTAIWGMGTSNMLGTFISSVYLHDLPPRMIDDYACEVQRQNFITECLTAHLRRSVPIPWGDPDRATERRIALRDCKHKYGLTHLLSTASPEPGLGLGHFLTLCRADPAQPWMPASRQLKERLFPHLIEAYALACCLHLGSHNAEERGRAIADRSLLIANITPAFKQLMLLEWPGWVGWRMPPEVCAAWLGGSRGLRYKGKHVVIGMESDQQLVHLTVRRCNLLDVLTSRELAVARLFARGLKHKAVAIEIGISPNTVRNQIKSIYDKLDVSNKTSLAACMDDLS